MRPVMRRGRRARSRYTVALERRFTTPEEAARRGAGRWQVVIPRAPIDRRPPVAYGKQHVDLEARAGHEYPDLGVVELKKGYLIGPNGWVATPTGELITEFSWHGRDAPRMRLPKAPLRVRRLEGTCLSLTSDWSIHNYGHFLLDGLGRSELYRRAGYTLDEVDHVYCGAPHPGAARLLERLGIREDQLVRPKGGVAVQADTLIASSFPGLRADYPPWLATSLRSAVGPGTDRPGSRRLYVPRTTTRLISNEAALRPILAAHGFEIYDPVEHDDPPADFAEAAIVVGAHGAGLADIVFCPPGASVLELFPSDHVYRYWFTLAASAELRYGYLVGRSEGHRPPGAWGPSPYPFQLDEDEFRLALERVVAQSREGSA